ncbi:MAG TPA: metal-dependent hydrolase [Burkholderiales bacterium]|nr:metal-dependent hydrolase [Burkholderiales bacterium]
MLPDADVFIRSNTDPLVTLEYHRQFTHSFLAAPVGALIVAVALWLLTRRRPGFGSLYWPALAGYVSALLLDACTSYGTQLLWPFMDRRFAASIVAVVDPVVTLILLIGIVIALRRADARPALLAIGFMLAYLGAGAWQHERAQAVIEQVAARRGHVIAKHEVKPTLGNLLLWRSVYLTGNEFVVDAVRVGLISDPVLYPGGQVRRVQPRDLVPPLTRNSVQAQDVARFATVSEGYLARHPTRPSVIGDVRYSMLPDSTLPLWGIEIVATRESQHVALHSFRNLGATERSRFSVMLRGVAVDH